MRSVIKAEVDLFAPDSDRSAALAVLSVRIWLCLDSSGQYLAVEASQLKLISALDREPILRFEYDRGAATKPGAHIQIHAHRGALSHLLAKTEHANPHAMESLHLPTGGDRFRLCLEDVVEFLIIECGFDKLAGWQDAVRAGRVRWRRLQLLSAVRDAPGVAVDALTNLGYTVAEPADGSASGRDRNLVRW